MTLFARRYDIVDLLGQGGFGAVWRAFDRNLNREVAVKLFRPGFPPGLVFTEAQTHVALAGPHVLQVLDAAIYNDVPYIVSSVAQERSAMDRTYGKHGVRTDTAVRWTRHLLSGLQACHNNELLHRDVKPANLFLLTLDTAALGDFGLIERIVGGRTPAHGTTAFQPIEALNTGFMTVQADVYASGVTLWMMLTGDHPFLDPITPASEVPQRIAAGVPRLRDVAPHVPSTLAAVVERACSLDTSVRYASAVEMDHALGSLARRARLWKEVAPNSHEARRWESTPARGEAGGLVVIVSNSGRHWNIETRRAGGAQGRLVPHCHSNVSNAQLAARLRAVFNALG